MMQTRHIQNVNAHGVALIHMYPVFLRNFLSRSETRKYLRNRLRSVGPKYLRNGPVLAKSLAFINCEDGA